MQKFKSNFQGNCKNRATREDGGQGTVKHAGPPPR
jgi:hypothetical protein